MLALRSFGCRSPTGSDRRLPERSPLCLRKAQEKCADTAPAPTPPLAHSPLQGAAESAPKGGNYISL